MTTYTYTAHFSPEAWQNDVAVPVDPEGDQTWDATVAVNEHLAYFDALAMKDEGGWDAAGLMNIGILDNDDVLRNDPTAPAWVRNWHGPFIIRVQRVAREEYNEYTVRWEIDITATDPEDAARQALAVHRDPESIATFFEVISEDNSVTNVDLA